MTDEQKAKRRAWAASHFGDKNLTDEELDCATYMPSENFSDGWDKGADFALSHQWISVEERLPELRERVLICEKIANQYKIFIGKRVPFNDGWEWNQSTKESVVAWMPLPKFNPEKQSI